MAYDQLIQQAVDEALKMMNEAGFGLSVPIKVILDKNLPFMGYTTEIRRKNIIVVSGMAVKSGLLEGLLIHEMSHIYRTEAKHPSHNHALLNAVLTLYISKHGVREDYQLRILKQIINHIQDLYADDISFKVFEKNPEKLFSTDRMRDFFNSWIKTGPARSTDKTADGWLNAAMVLNNCFAISNMERHKITDDSGWAAKANQKFLESLGTKFSEGFTHFKNFMLNLREDCTESEFQEQIDQYLLRFLDLTSDDRQ